MRFLTDPDKPAFGGRLSYVAGDYSFDFLPETAARGIASLLVNDLQLEIDEEGHVLWVWGMCPASSWNEMSLSPPTFIPGGLKALLDSEVVPGVSYRLTESAAWAVHVDWDRGWVCLGEAEFARATEAVEFASNSVGVISEGMLVALWLCPENLGEVKKWSARRKP